LTAKIENNGYINLLVKSDLTQWVKKHLLYSVPQFENLMKTRFSFFIMVLILLAGCGGNSGSGEPSDKASGTKEVTPAPVDNVAAGEKIFRTYCITCHGIDGKLGLNGAKDLSVSQITREERILQVTKGKGLMTPFEGILNPDQIQQVVEYTETLKAQ
jgi:mono/diheme cytochrome c family protein